MSSEYGDFSWRLPVEKSREFVRSYGLGLLFAANVFGAGSVYILSNTGAEFGFALLWTLPFALLVDLGMREMAGRLASIDEPLMDFIRREIGSAPAKAFSVSIAFIMHFWAIANYAVGGAALAWLTPLDNVYVGVVLVAGVGISLVELRVYDRVETAIAAVICTVFGIYLLLALGLDLPVGKVAKGFVPAVKGDFSYLTMVVSLMGTTVYYPNFFIQSSIQGTKEWTDMSKYRRDNVVGTGFVVVLSVAVIAVAAMTLDPHTPTLASPGEPLRQLLGPEALTVFVFAVFLASFSSATGTLFAAGYMVPQAWDRDTVFGDHLFRRVVEVLIVAAVCFAVLLLEFTDATPVQLGIIMPGVNGIVGLPVTALALYYANERFFDHPRWLSAGFAVITTLMFVMAALTAHSLFQQIVSWL